MENGLNKLEQKLEAICTNTKNRANEKCVVNVSYVWRSRFKVIEFEKLRYI